MAQATRSDVSVMDLDSNGRVTFSELVMSLAVLGGLVFFGLLFGAVGVGGLVGVPGRELWRFVGRWWLWLSLSMAVAVVIGVGVWRCLRYERMEKLTRLEVARRWQFEDDDRDRLLDVAGRDRGTRLSQSAVDGAAVVYLRKYYNAGELSRERWMRAGLSKDLWDAVNALMLKRGIRRGRKAELVPASFADAWQQYVDGKLRSRSWSVTGDGDFLEEV